MDTISPTHARQVLRHLPKEVNDIYNETLQRIDGQVEAKKALAQKAICWIVHAYRQLSLKELQHALAVERGMLAMDPDSLVDGSMLTSVCCGLVVIDEDTVDLTRLEGPQWSAGDFKEESTAAQLEPSTPVHNGADRAANQAAKAVTNSLTHKDAPDKNKPVPVVDKEIIEIAKRREQKRNLRAQPAESDEPPSLAKILLDRLTPGWEEEERKEEERKEEARRAGV